MRQIVLDTETTGLSPEQGHRIIEIGCVELIDRKLTGQHYHQYLRPDREVEQAAIEVHGITNESLADMPEFSAIAADFIDYVRGAELIIHNADFDIGFLDCELDRMAGFEERMAQICPIVDTLSMARDKHPGQRNSLDALCLRYGVDNSQRELHGALRDAEILADVYLAMTGGQTSLWLGDSGAGTGAAPASAGARRLGADRPRLKVIRASPAESEAHRRALAGIDQASGGKLAWREPPAED